MNLKGKTIVLGVTGGIACYKIATLASALKKADADVHVIMTNSATQFITPLTFETLTNNRCIIDVFARDFSWNVKHVSLAKQADVFVVAPATANIIAKLANGLADDMLTTTVLAADCPKIVVPSMNTGMYDNPITQDNIEKLKKYGFTIVEPESGILACGDSGKGRLPETDVMLSAIYSTVKQKDLTGKKVLVTAGPTQEMIDPVRFITNHSSGKMGYAVAEAAAMRGADVVLVSGKTNLDKPYNVNRVDVTSAKEMFDAVKDNFKDADFIIKTAAVADYTPVKISDSKIKKSDNNISLSLKRTDDILKYIGENKKSSQKVCGFSMETDDLLENSTNKLKSKNADLIVANSLNQDGAGFMVDTNKVTIIDDFGNEELPEMSKRDLADLILDRMLNL